MAESLSKSTMVHAAGSMAVDEANFMHFDAVRYSEEQRVWALGFRVWGLGFQGLGLRA